MTNKMRAMWVFLPALLFAVLAVTKPATAEQETFRVKSMSEARVQIQFFSKDRHVRWPGPDRAYNLDDYNEHEYTLNCIRDEKICYGAWVKGNKNRYWGVGADGRAGCDGCCYRCEGRDTRLIILRSPVSR